MLNPKKNVLVIGGTGIVGKPVVMRLLGEGKYNIYSIALEEANFPSTVTQYVVDRTTEEYVKIIERLNSEIDVWDAVIDIVSFSEESARSTYTLFKNDAQHIITLSTSLVYNREAKNLDPISEDVDLAPEGSFGGYVDGKVKLERFWKSVTDVNWTLLRPYHILGAESLLGCIPEHNRDPKIIQRIRNCESLKLCNGGDIEFNYVHPKDIAVAISKIIGQPKTFKQAYNLVNPKAVFAKDYYAEIAKQIGCTIKIENIPMDVVWGEMKGWEMTTLPHVYSMQKMQNDIGFTPNISLDECISDAIKYPAVVSENIIPVHQRMNKLPQPNKISWLR